MRRLPVIPTIFVLAAVAVMVALGMWQIQRANWKHELLTRYADAAQDDTPVAWPVSASSRE